MAKDAEKRKDKLYNVLALLLMAALFGCGVWGVVESRIAKRDYKNSPDVRQVSAVVSSYRTIESKDDDGDVISTKYEAKLIFEVDGRFYYDTGITGEVMGEPTDPFMAIDVTEDGCLLYQMGMILLERA